jgi:polyferredoxin
MPNPLRSFYAGPYRYFSVLFILVIAIAGYFMPVIGLAVPGLMVLALVMNRHVTRSFCSTACPNGRALAVVTRPLSLDRRLPEFLTNPGLRRALCGFMMFCVISLLARYGKGGVPAIGRIFWAIYVLATGIGFVVGIVSKPRSWCAFCPMGTLQDTIATTSRVQRDKA